MSTAIQELHKNFAVSKPEYSGMLQNIQNKLPQVTTYFNTIDYITLATTGNATTFGTLASAIAPSNSATSSPTRGVWMGGANANANVARVMRYITIDTTGNSLTFGELSTIRINGAACSNGHGGL